MFKTTQFIPGDFEHTASEEYLLIYEGTDEGRHLFSDSNLHSILHQMEVPFNHAEDGPHWTLPDELRANVNDWIKEASALASMPRKPVNIKFEFVKNAWVLNREWDDLVLLGEGQGYWIVLHWFTTA